MTEDPKKPWWKTVLSWPWKALVWLKSRRSARGVARALATNQVATAALAASVAAAGVGGYATYKTVQEGHRIDAQEASQRILAQRLAAVEIDQRSATVALAQLQYQQDVLKSERTQDMKNMSKQLGVLSNRVAAVSDDVAALPSVPDSKPAIAAARDLAVKAQAAADKAQKTANDAAKAAQKAQDAAVAAQASATDPEARAKAAEALRAAQDAAAAAKEAKGAAQAASSAAVAAQVGADGANAKIDALPPGYQPFPRTITVADVVTTQVAGPASRAFTVDLPKGTYTVSLTADIETGLSPQYILITSPGLVDGRFSTGGGTVAFTISMDATVNHGQAASWKNITVTLEKS